ncbi:MAG: lysophospholipid acyltransferase family protein [Lutibacter sp.]|uniref:lysophospholipid acyltransferase family protein n=1 Tax=Lutibacter sp. TaxID=1925666 RepID=UPI00299D38E9|nr:lysophospholipid acyltransferase family protein [Lutibacter sp.]MDX1829795.1 lysophospholipid acyltransferase family protein [Lutibacter sp.]
MKIVKYLLGITRLLLFAIMTSTIFGWLLFTNLFISSEVKKLKRGILYRRFIIRNLIVLLGSKIITYGKVPTQSGLIISNHRTYFDSIVILQHILAYPIAKIELASWPLVGDVCKTTGVIFVKREDKSSRKDTLQKAQSILKNGFSILNTPEGTTHIEPTTIAFKPGAFKLAAQLNVPVIPIAIDYKLLSDAWIGDDTFLPHFIRCFGKWRTEIKISYLPPIYGDDPEELIKKSKESIDNELIRFRKDWDLKDKATKN